MIVDANVILRAFFPDEAQAQAQAVVREHVAGRIHLVAPALLPYELSNAVWQAERRGRIPRAQADDILQAMAGLDIEIIPQTWGVMLPLARQFDRSAYDAAYLTLAQDAGQQFLTGDLRLYNAVHNQLDWVLWIEDYAGLPEEQSSGEDQRRMNPADLRLPDLSGVISSHGD
jgi:predicted nucleic acid-binding protein